MRFRNVLLRVVDRWWREGLKRPVSLQGVLHKKLVATAPRVAALVEYEDRAF